MRSKKNNKSRAEFNGLVKGHPVTVVTSIKTGNRHVYLYDTGASWYTEKGDIVTNEHWNGEEEVSFYNGD